MVEDEVRLAETVRRGLTDSGFAVPWGYLTITVRAVVAALAMAALVRARASTRPAVEELRDR